MTFENFKYIFKKFNSYNSSKILKFSKNFKATVWSDCHGSIGEYYSISNLPENDKLFFSKKISKVLNLGLYYEVMEQSINLLQLFSNGNYKNRLCQSFEYKFDVLTYK